MVENLYMINAIASWKQGDSKFIIMEIEDDNNNNVG